MSDNKVLNKNDDSLGESSGDESTPSDAVSDGFNIKGEPVNKPKKVKKKCFLLLFSVK